MCHAGIISSGFVEVMIEEKRPRMLGEARSRSYGSFDLGENSPMRAMASFVAPAPASATPPAASARQSGVQRDDDAVVAAPGEDHAACELLALRQAAAALRRQEVSLALCLLEERIAALTCNAPASDHH